MSHKTWIFFNSEYCYFTYHEGNCAIHQLYGTNHLTRVAVVLSSAEMLLYLGIAKRKTSCFMFCEYCVALNNISFHELPPAHPDLATIHQSYMFQSLTFSGLNAKCFLCQLEFSHLAWTFKFPNCSNLQIQ